MDHGSTDKPEEVTPLWDPDRPDRLSAVGKSLATQAAAALIPVYQRGIKAGYLPDDLHDLIVRAAASVLMGATQSLNVTFGGDKVDQEKPPEGPFRIMVWLGIGDLWQSIPEGPQADYPNAMKTAESYVRRGQRVRIWALNGWRWEGGGDATGVR